MITIDGGTGIITSNNRLQLPANSGGSGNVIQVQSTTTKSNDTVTGSGYSILGALSCTITPKLATSTLLFQYAIQARIYNNSGGEAHSYIAVSDDDGSTYLAENYHRSYDYGNSGTLIDIGVSSFAIKTAGSTSARTYKIYAKKVEGTAFEMNPASNENVSGVTIMEIAA